MYYMYIYSFIVAKSSVLLVSPQKISGQVLPTRTPNLRRPIWAHVQFHNPRIQGSGLLCRRSLLGNHRTSLSEPQPLGRKKCCRAWPTGSDWND